MVKGKVITESTASKKADKGHVPLIEVENQGNGEGIILEIKVGDVQHHSVDNHHIQWIEVYDGNKLLGRVELTESCSPKITFYLKEHPKRLLIREFCSLHGFWESEIW